MGGEYMTSISQDRYMEREGEHLKSICLDRHVEDERQAVDMHTT